MTDAEASESSRGRRGARRRFAAAAKVLLAFVAVVTVAALPPSLGLWAALALPLLLTYLVFAHISVRAWLRAVLLGEPFVLGASLLLLLRPNGVALFAAVVVKATVCLAVLQALIHSMPFHQLLDVLRTARLPRALTDTLALLHRYVPVLAEEATRMRRARAARAFGHPRVSSWRLLAGVVGILFVRSTQRAERVDAAMRARGWS